MMIFSPSLERLPFEWVSLDEVWLKENFGWSYINSTLAWGAFAHGVLLMIVSHQPVEDEDIESSESESKWHVFMIYHQELEGNSGVELFEVFDTLDEAKFYVEATKGESIQLIEEYINDNMI